MKVSIHSISSRIHLQLLQYQLIIASKITRWKSNKLLMKTLYTVLAWTISLLCANWLFAKWNID